MASPVVSHPGCPTEGSAFRVVLASGAAGWARGLLTNVSEFPKRWRFAVASGIFLSPGCREASGTVYFWWCAVSLVCEVGAAAATCCCFESSVSERKASSSLRDGSLPPSLSFSFSPSFHSNCRTFYK